MQVDVDVGEIAKKFNGGGSETVAAFQATGDIKEIEKQLVEAISPTLKNITTIEKTLF